jgi:hypothetical protein
LLRRNNGLGKYSDLCHLIHIIAVVVQPGGSVVLERTRLGVGVTQLRVTTPAGSAMSTVGHEGHDAAIAGRNPGYARAYLYYGACALMPEDYW